MLRAGCKHNIIERQTFIKPTALIVGRLQKMRLAKFRIFDGEDGRLVPDDYQLVEK